MTELIASLLPHIIVGLFVLAVILFLLSLQQLRRGRTGPYWRLRRAAGQRGGQLFLISLVLFGVAFALALFSGLADLAYRRLTASLNSDPDALVGVVLPTSTPTLQYSLTPTVTDTPTSTTAPTTAPDTHTPEPTPSVTPTITPLPTETTEPTPTLTPTETFESVLVLTPPPSTQRPRLGAAVDIVAASVNISPTGEALETMTEFPAGTQRIYFFFEYRNLDDRVTWTRVLYRDGVPIQGGSYSWSLGESGSSFFFFGSDTGYPPGNYQTRVFLGEDEVSRFEFSILPP